MASLLKNKWFWLAVVIIAIFVVAWGLGYLTTLGLSGFV